VRAGTALGFAALLVPSALNASPSMTPCEDSGMHLEGRPAPRWARALLQACEELRTMPDRDPGASLQIEAAGDDLVALVTLGGGRSTLRRLSDPATLGPTLEALLSLPPPGTRPAEPAAAPTAPSSSAAKVQPLSPSSPAPPDAAAQATLPGGFGVEFGAGAAGRAAGAAGYLSVAPTAFAQLRAGRWLFGMGVRWEVAEWNRNVHVEDFDMVTVATGVHVARRFVFGLAALDLGVSPRFVAETVGFQTGTGEISVTESDLRLASFLTVAVGRPELRGFVTVDGELSPGRMVHPVRSDPALPALPAWSVGLELGVSLGTP
jgi:hypothetical protein